MATHGHSNPRGQIAVRVKGQNKCPSHRRNNVVFLCQDCNTLICTSCTITTHKNHIDSFLEIIKIANTQNNVLRNFVNDADDIKIPKLNKDIISAKKELGTYQPKYKTLSENIKKHRDQCRQDLDKITDNYISVCAQMEGAATDLMQTHIKNLEERLESLVKLSSECKQTLQTGTAVLLYDSVSEIQDMHFNDTPQTPNIGMTEFIQGKDRQSHLEQAMGNIKTPPDHLQAESATGGHSIQGPAVKPKQSKSTVKGQASTRAVLYKLCDSPTVMSQFSYPDGITSICPTADGRAWLCDCDTNTVNLINNTGTLFTNKAKVIQKIQHDSDITSISLDPTTGRLWFCCFNERTIHEVSKSSTPVTRFTTEGDPTSLCVTMEGRVVVAIYMHSPQGYEVVMYTADGRVLHTAIVEGSGAGVVGSVTQCGVTGNIAVVSSELISGDSFDMNNYIIVYNPTLQPLVHYRGEGIQAREAVTPDKFGPGTVVYDSKGNIVIADITRNTIELISGAGKYIKTLHTNKDQGTLGIQKDDVLWSNMLLDTDKLGLNLLKYYSD